MTKKKNSNEVDQTWEKGKKIPGENPDVYRKDVYGNKIRKGSYGTEGEYGWEIDHKKPQAKGGTDKPQNKQPLHWQENRAKADKYPYKPKKK